MPVAILAVRFASPFATLVERSTYLAYGLPGIVVGLALIVVCINFVPGVYGTTAVLLVAYAILALPLALVAVRGALAQAPPVHEEVARSLGLRPWAARLRVTLPAILPGLGAAAALVFLATVTELTATLLLAPIGTNTLATGFWSSASTLSYAAAAPYAALMVLISAVPTYLLTRKVAAFGGLTRHERGSGPDRSKTCRRTSTRPFSAASTSRSTPARSRPCSAPRAAARRRCCA